MRKYQFLNTDDPLYGKQIANNNKTVINAKSKKSEESAGKQQATEAGKQVMGALAPEGMNAGANLVFNESMSISTYLKLLSSPAYPMI